MRKRAGLGEDTGGPSVVVHHSSLGVDDEARSGASSLLTSWQFVVAVAPHRGRISMIADGRAASDWRSCMHPCRPIGGWDTRATRFGLANAVRVFAGDSDVGRGRRGGSVLSAISRLILIGAAREVSGSREAAKWPAR